MATRQQSPTQLKVNTKQTADDAYDTVVGWLKIVGFFLLVVYGLTLGYDQAAWFFNLPQASPTEVGGALLFVRLVVHEVYRIYRIFRP